MGEQRSAKVRLDPADEFMHENTGEPNFNESMYFNFFDPAQGRGGFLRLGNRPNEGHAEMTVCLYEPDGSVVFNFKRARDPRQRGSSRPGAPASRWSSPSNASASRTAARPACWRARSRCATPSGPSRRTPSSSVRLDLLVEGVGPMFGGERAGAASQHEMEFAKGHYEQHHRARGTLEIAGRRFDVDGLGLRDHSWGPRYWQAPAWYRWLTANFGADLGFMASVVASKDGSESRGGFVHRGRELVLVKQVELETGWADPEHVHDTLRLRLHCADGSTLAVEGRVLSLIPLRNRRAGQTTRISEGMTRWECDGRIGYGLSEYLDQVS